MSDNIPSVTHLQFLVLGTLVGGEQPGRDIRKIIGQFGVRSTTVVIISESVWRRFFPGESAVGRRVRTGERR